MGVDNIRKRARFGISPSIWFILASAMPSSAAMAQSPNETFRNVCISTGAQTAAAISAARNAGFTPSKTKPPTPAGITQFVAMERGEGSAKLAFVVSVGTSTINKGVETEVPVRGCSLTAVSDVWNIRAFTREWIGHAPQIDEGGIFAYSYFERPTGIALADNNVLDLPALISATNAGELRALTGIERNGMRGLSWLIFETPATPLTIPDNTIPLPVHETDPFAPCRWDNKGKGRNLSRTFSCPDKTGAFYLAPNKGVTEETPALARNGDVASMLRLATFYVNGPSLVRDLGSAFLWSKRAAEAGAPDGAFNTGLAYENGIGVVANETEAQRWYRIAADQQHSSAKINLAALLLDKTASDHVVDHKLAVALVREAANAGALVGPFNMGYLSENGIGVEKDMAEAMRWYQIGADRSDSLAMLRLGLIHAEGIGGLPQNEEEGARMIAASIKPSLRIAEAIIGIDALIYGFNDPKRRAEIMRSVTSNSDLAMRLGLHLASPTTPKRNPEEAASLLRVAAEAGLPLAALRLGVMYAEGDGVARNNAEAINWMRFDGRLRKITSFQRITNFAEAALP